MEIPRTAAAAAESKDPIGRLVLNAQELDAFKESICIVFDTFAKLASTSKVPPSPNHTSNRNALFDIIRMLAAELNVKDVTGLRVPASTHLNVGSGEGNNTDFGVTDSEATDFEGPTTDAASATTASEDNEEEEEEETDEDEGNTTSYLYEDEETAESSECSGEAEGTGEEEDEDGDYYYETN